ncbi:MAG TPA: helix-turn-helix transcriptional regulator [Caulobacteraceae bacterium]|nr:helix-turn-helix transcriptional regulator [Caulobacteraceae bacterium]
MNNRCSNYLRAYRKRWKLSEEELARLLGGVSASMICRLENGTREPTGKFVLGCEVVFGIPPRNLFSNLYEATQDIVMRRAARLSLSLEDRADRASALKRELLRDMINRAGNAPLA